MKRSWTTKTVSDMQLVKVHMMASRVWGYDGKITKDLEQLLKERHGIRLGRTR